MVTELPDSEEQPPVLSAEEDSPAPEEPFRIEDGRLRRLHEDYVKVERIVSWIFTGSLLLAGLVPLILGIVLQWFAPWVTLVLGGCWFLLGLVLGWFSHVYPRLDFEHSRFRVSPLGVEVHRGVFWRQVVSVSRFRVQHTDVSQGPFQRRYGMATLTIHTAGTEKASVQVSGLHHEEALAIRQFLLQGGAESAW